MIKAEDIYLATNLKILQGCCSLDKNKHRTVESYNELKAAKQTAHTWFGAIGDLTT